MKAIKLNITNLTCCEEGEVIVNRSNSNSHVINESLNLDNDTISFDEKIVCPEGGETR